MGIYQRGRKWSNNYPKSSWARRSPLAQTSATNFSRCLPVEWVIHRCRTQHPWRWVAMSIQYLVAASKKNCQKNPRFKQKIKQVWWISYNHIVYKIWQLLDIKGLMRSIFVGAPIAFDEKAYYNHFRSKFYK